jgi:DNA helicase-2/ATP-dependent DNA helicase PcrA
MLLVADLHVHSRFSRATSRDLDFPALVRSALEKGVGLVATGDFTHPGWMREIREQLVEAEPGLLRLRDDLDARAREGLPAACAAGSVRFVIGVEISNIYKKAGRVRKNHNLVFVPGLEAAGRFTERLASIGNLGSDGRPILGLDARDLLEITLETDPLAFLVPAHIWTPWFSALGSMSGFDSLDECFGDLAPHVFAAETGLSSDPAMNWRVSALDRVTLVSSSDAHSPARLGREASLLEVELGYEPLHRALRTREGFLGTIEFFPEEGKYHLDGHRKCGVRLDPERTRELGGTCPVCGGKVTVGVMSRVLDLADRPCGFRPPDARPFTSLVSLGQVVGEAIGVAAESQRVRAFVERLLAGIGPELVVLREAPLEQVSRAGTPVIAEAIRRVRAAELSVEGGYDGEYGVVRIFEPAERDRFAGQSVLGGIEPSAAARARRPRRDAPTDSPVAGAATQREPPEARSKRARPAQGSVGSTQPPLAPSRPLHPTEGLDEHQSRVAHADGGPLLVVAGPGTGKTRTLVARMARLVASGKARDDRLLAISFTNQAAEELRERLDAAIGPSRARRATVTTFHGLGLRLLRELAGDDRPVAEDQERLAIAQSVLGEGAGARDASRLLDRVSLAKQTPDPRESLRDDPETLARFDRFEAALGRAGRRDLDDLVLGAYRLVRDSPEAARDAAGRFDSVSVDEYQDVNDVQAAFVRLLSPGGCALCAIGDPDQAIYGFRGARPAHFFGFAQAYEGAVTTTLGTSYRLTRPVLESARAVLGGAGFAAGLGACALRAVRDGPAVQIVDCPSARAEAEQILVRLESLVGGTSLFAVDSGRGDRAEHADLGFGDVAVLVRTKAQRGEVLEALGRSAVPCIAVGEDEPHDPRSQKVAVMTMHAAKGREYAVVFVAGVERGLVPLELDGFDTDPSEEARLLYVAITRAKRLAVITHAARRRLFGRELPGGPSPLLERLAAPWVERTRARLPRRAPPSGQLTLF